MKTPHHRPRQAGFTLIELMVAMGITAIIITVLVSITGIATDTWTRSRAEVRAARQAKVMLETMARDFESLVARRGNDFEWLHAELESGNLPSVAQGGGSGDAIALTLLTAATDRYLGRIGEDYPENAGDISCVSYRLRYQDPIEGGNDKRTSTFVLYRLLVDPDDTFKDILGQPDLDAAFASYKGQVDDQENFICENVHQFSFAFHVEVTRQPTGGGAAVTETARVVLGSGGGKGDFRITGRGIETTLTSGSITAEQLKAGRLKAVEVSMSVLSDSAVIRMGSADGLNEDDYNRNVFHYTRMIQLPGM